MTVASNLSQAIPELVTWLETKKADGPEFAQLSTHMHHFGVNVRCVAFVELTLS